MAGLSGDNFVQVPLGSALSMPNPKSLDALSKAVTELAAKEQERAAKAQQDAQKELMAHTYEKAQAYEKAVIAAGYAGFFATWGFLKDTLNETLMVIASMMVTVSLSVFIAFQVYQMIVTSTIFLAAAQRLQLEPLKFIEAQKEYATKRRDLLVKLRPLWTIALALSVGPALIALVLLGASYVIYLWDKLTG